MNTEVTRKILAYIDEHIQEKISLSELAELVGYSPFYFSKLFSESFGMPVTGYVRMRKLQYALASLSEGKAVLEVSLLYAFDSHEGFTRSFTQLFGITPGKVKKYLTSYRVPQYSVPDMEIRRIDMGFDKNVLSDNLHQIVFEVLKASLEEAKEGFCTEIQITLLGDGRIKIADNGRGIPLVDNLKSMDESAKGTNARDENVIGTDSRDKKHNRQMLDNILAGHPISQMEYERLGDLPLSSLQTVNSLCESLQIKVYRNGTCYTQDYVRGIACHEVIYSESERGSGTEMLLKPDRMIFGDLKVSVDVIRAWIAEVFNKNAETPVVINIAEETKSL